jgi:hypothetical protein
VRKRELASDIIVYYMVLTYQPNPDVMTRKHVINRNISAMLEYINEHLSSMLKVPRRSLLYLILNISGSFDRYGGG